VIHLDHADRNTHEELCDSLELFRREVKLEFYDRERAHQEWKKRVLAGEIQREEIDTAGHDF
jgi:hypothetical protein